MAGSAGKMDGREQNQIVAVNSGRGLFLFPIVVICKWPYCVEVLERRRGR